MLVNGITSCAPLGPRAIAHIKAGAGHAIGGMAVEAVGGLLGALFSSDGGASKKRKK